MKKPKRAHIVPAVEVGRMDIDGLILLIAWVDQLTSSHMSGNAFVGKSGLRPISEPSPSRPREI